MLHQGGLETGMNFKTKEKDSKDSLQIVQKLEIFKLFLFVVFNGIFFQELLEKMMSYEQEKIDVLKDLRERVFTRFCDKFEEWNNAIQCLATLDVFMSLAEYCRCEEEVMCIPTFIPAIVGKKVGSII